MSLVSNNGPKKSLNFVQPEEWSVWISRWRKWLYTATVTSTITKMCWSRKLVSLASLDLWEFLLLWLSDAGEPAWGVNHSWLKDITNIYCFKIITCALAVLCKAGIVFSGVCFLSGCPCVQKTKKSYFSLTDVTLYQYLWWWTLEVIRFRRHLTLSFDLQRKLLETTVQIMIQSYIVMHLTLFFRLSKSWNIWPWPLTIRAVCFSIFPVFLVLASAVAACRFIVPMDTSFITIIVIILSLWSGFLHYCWQNS